MPRTTITSTALRNNAGEAIDAALRGEETAITFHGVVAAFIVPARFDARTMGIEPQLSPEFDALVLQGTIVPGSKRTRRA